MLSDSILDFTDGEITKDELSDAIDYYADSDIYDTETIESARSALQNDDEEALGQVIDQLNSV